MAMLPSLCALVALILRVAAPTVAVVHSRHAVSGAVVRLLLAFLVIHLQYRLGPAELQEAPGQQPAPRPGRIRCT